MYCIRAEFCFNEEGSSNRPSKICRCISELWWRNSLLLLQLNRCMNIFGFVSAKWFYWKKKGCRGISLRVPQNVWRWRFLPAEPLRARLRGWSWCCVLRFTDKHLWVPCCYTDHKDMLDGGLQTHTCCLRLTHTQISMQTRVFDVYLIILGTLSGSAAPSVTSLTQFMIDLWHCWI